MEHSKYFERVKNWYKLGLWNEARVENAVRCGWITEEEFRMIVGRDFA